MDDTLSTIAIILVILWLLAMVSGITLGGGVWLLFAVACAFFIASLIVGASPYHRGDY